MLVRLGTDDRFCIHTYLSFSHAFCQLFIRTIRLVHYKLLSLRNVLQSVKVVNA